MAMPTTAPAECRGTYAVSNGYRLVAGDTCDSSKGVDHLPTIKRCPGLFSGAAAEVSSGGWTVLLVLLALLGVLVFITLRNRGASAPGLRDCMSVLPTDLPSLLVCLAQIPGILMEIPGALKGLWESARANRKPQYGRLPDTADDELDLGDDEMDEVRPPCPRAARLLHAPPSMQPPPPPCTPPHAAAHRTGSRTPPRAGTTVGRRRRAWLPSSVPSRAAARVAALRCPIAFSGGGGRLRFPSAPG